MTMSGPALRRFGALSLLFVGAACSEQVPTTPSARSFSPALSRVATPAAGQHVFLLNGNSVPDDFAAKVAARGGSILSSMSQIGVVVTRGLSDADASAIAGNNAVTSDYEGLWIDPTEMQLSSVTFDTPVDVASAKPPLTAAFLPFQWNMFQIHAPEAWASGRSGVPTVRVAMLDTGIDPDHLDTHGLIDVAASRAFVPSVSGPPEWADDNLHGTFTGAIVTSNNFGVAGVAPNVTLIAVKVLGASGSGPIGAVIAGIYYATDVGAQVINMSLGLAIPKNAKGASTLLAAMNRAVNYAHRHGVFVVSAAGNEFTDLQHDRNFVELPCEAGVQVCVSATGNGDTHASYSNYGVSAIDVAAPGGDGPPSLATWILGPCSSRNVNPLFQNCKNRVSYIIATGTSASAPHVAGLGAYLDSQFGGQLNGSQIATLIEQNADDIGKPGTDQFFGKGRINVVNTVTTTHP